MVICHAGLFIHVSKRFFRIQVLYEEDYLACIPFDWAFLTFESSAV